jgi:hypothetical protein
MLKPLTFADTYPQEMNFLKNAKKDYILMSDEQEVLCYQSFDQSNSDKFTVFFVQGFGAGVYSWTDLWDELCKEYNLIVLEPRDKESVKLGNKKECTVQRIALDIAESVHYLKISFEKLIFFGSSIGAVYIANNLRRKLTNPKCCFFAAPSIKPRNPKFLLKLALFLPSKFVDKLGKFIGRRYLKNKVAEGFQRKVFYSRIDNIDVNRWKQCIKLHNYNSKEDFASVECPVYLITTSGDKYHELEAVEKVHKLIKNSKIVNVPSYEYYHTYPGVKEFLNQISNIINNK